MQFELDFRSGIPIYEQIMEHIRQMVKDGLLKPGDQLPTVRQLATDLRINFNTVARAYSLLDEAGLISTQHGRGTYIWDASQAQESLERIGLEALAQRFIKEARKRGYTVEETRTTIEALLNAWESGSLNTEDSD